MTGLEQNMEIYRTIKLSDSNIHGDLHGGVILSLMEEAGYICTTRYLNDINIEYKCPILYKLEKVSFIKSASIGDFVMAKADVVFTFLDKIAVKVKIFIDTFKENPKLLSEYIKLRAFLWFINTEICTAERCFNSKIVPIFNNIITNDYYEAEILYKTNQNMDENNDHIDFKNLKAYMKKFSESILRNNANSSFLNAFPTQILPTIIDCSHFGIVNCGYILLHIDNLAGLVASRHCKGAAITVGIHVSILACTAYFTFVVIDRQKKLIDVPPLILQSDEE
ncbi:hypothetical protein MXB_4519, partial [Myxobolus squamalis]